MKLIALLAAFFIDTQIARSAQNYFNFANQPSHEIVFDDIAKTSFDKKDHSIHMKVLKSASVLLYPFSNIVKTKAVSFEWKYQGTLKVKSKAHQASKGGDDAILRVGLLVSGKPPLVPFFAPSWIKKTQHILLQPSNKLLYLTVGSEFDPGNIWESPYSSSIQSIAVASKSKADGFLYSSHRFANYKKLVGLWIMADGDNTGSQFTVVLRNLQIYELAD